MQKIYIVEDDESIRELVLYALKSQFDAVGFSNPPDFWQSMKAVTPDLVLLYIMLPDEDGISILKRLKSGVRTKRLPVIMLTAKTNEYDRVNGLDLGADDYITKPFSVLELISRIKAVLRRSAMPEDAEKSIRTDNITLYPDKREVIAGNVSISLTYKEFELLQLLMENRGVVLSRDKIMAQIWGTDFEGEKCGL